MESRHHERREKSKRAIMRRQKSMGTQQSRKRLEWFGNYRQVQFQVKIE